MGKSDTNWKLHFWWAMCLSAVLLLSVITFWLGGKGSEIVSYVGFAGACTSIALAIIAIIFSFIYNSRSQQNLGEMRSLISEASQAMVRQADVLTEKAGSMELNSLSIKKFLQSTEHVSSPRPDLKGQTFRLNASYCSNQGLMILYFLAQCCEHDREPSSDKLWLCLYGPVLSINHRLLDIFSNGFVEGISCFLEPGSTTKREFTEKGKTVRFPEGFKKYIRDAISKRVEESCFDKKDKAQWSEPIDRIDTYAKTGEVEMSGYGT